MNFARFVFQSRVIIASGLALLIVSTFLPWYRWEVDAGPLSEKLDRIDPALRAKVAPGLSSAEDVLQTYGDIGPDAAHDSASLWSVTRSDSLAMRSIAFLIIAGVCTAGIASLTYMGTSKKNKSRRFKIKTGILLALAAVLLVSLVSFWFSTGSDASGDWWNRHPARNADTGQWRAEATDVGYFQIVASPGIGRWVAFAAALIVLAGAIVNFRASAPAAKLAPARIISPL